MLDIYIYICSWMGLCWINQLGTGGSHHLAAIGKSQVILHLQMAKVLPTSKTGDDDIITLKKYWICRIVVV